MPAHVTRLLGQMCPANRYRLLGISRLPVFIGKGREIPPRIFVKFLPELVNPGGPLHQKTSGLCRPVHLSGQNGSRYRVCVTRVNQTRNCRVLQLSALNSPSLRLAFGFLSFAPPRCRRGVTRSAARLASALQRLLAGGGIAEDFDGCRGARAARLKEIPCTRGPPE